MNEPRANIENPYNAHLEAMVSTLQDARWVIDEVFRNEMDNAALPSEQRLAAALLRAQMISLIFVRLQEAARGPFCTECEGAPVCARCGGAITPPTDPFLAG